MLIALLDLITLDALDSFTTVCEQFLVLLNFNSVMFTVSSKCSSLQLKPFGCSLDK